MLVQTSPVHAYLEQMRCIQQSYEYIQTNHLPFTTCSGLVLSPLHDLCNVYLPVSYVLQTKLIGIVSTYVFLFISQPGVYPDIQYVIYQ